MEHLAPIPTANLFDLRDKLSESQKALIREAITDFENDGNREQLKQRLECLYDRIVKPHLSGNIVGACGFPPWLLLLWTFGAFYLIKELIDQLPDTVEFKILWFQMKFNFRRRRKKQ